MSDLKTEEEEGEKKTTKDSVVKKKQETGVMVCKYGKRGETHGGS